MAEYIEREAALESVREKLLITDALPAGIPKDASTFTLASMQHSLEAIPAADVRPVAQGKWIDRDDDYYGWNMWACSACGEEFVLTEGTPDMNDYHFCPNCGADMRNAND